MSNGSLILKETLDFINSNLEILDNEGVFSFMDYVINNHLVLNMNTYNGRLYTFAVFMMKLFDNDIDELVSTLASEGWHKWGTFNDWNSNVTGHWDIDAAYDRLLNDFGGVPSADSTGSGEGDTYLKVDPNKYINKIDFTSAHRSIRGRSKWKLNIPIVGGWVELKRVDESLRDKLYVGVSGFVSGKYPQVIGKHDVFNLRYRYPEYQIESYNPEVVYMTINQLVDLYKEKFPKIKEKDISICTALPLEIVEKYNLPIYEGK